MKRFLSSVLLVCDRKHAKTCLTEGFITLGLRVENVDFENSRLLLGGLSIDDVLCADTPPEKIIQGGGTGTGIGILIQN